MLYYLRITLILIIAAITTNASETISPLSPFQSMISQNSPDLLLVTIKIAPDFQLYRNKIKIKDSPQGTLGTPILPDAILEHNAVLGDYFVYKNQVEIFVPVLTTKSQTIAITITYQGCKNLTYCLPETSETKEFSLNSPKLSPPKFKLTDFLNNSSIFSISQIFQYNYILILLCFFILGILIAFTPCVFPLLPILLTIIANKKASTSKSITISISYVMGNATSYAIAGILIAIFGSSVSTILYNSWFSLFLVIVFIALALALFELYDIRLPNFMHNKLTFKSHGSNASAYLTGLLSALFLSPCVTAPLAGALLYIATTKNAIIGSSALFVLGIGQGVPLLIIAIGGNKLLPKNGLWMVKVRQFLGFMMLAIAIYIAVRIAPEWLIYLASSIWALSFSLFFFKIQPKRQRLLLFTIPVAVLAMIFAIILSFNPLQSFFYYLFSNQNQLVAATNVGKQFKKITTISQLNIIMDNAKREHKPVIIDFSARWCMACREMDKTTFRNKQIVSQLAKFIVVRADITQVNSDSKLLQKQFAVFAPPTLIFINANGNIVKDKTIAGYISSARFLRILTEFNN